MSLLTRLFRSVQARLERVTRSKTRTRYEARLEQLDHRQLLSVTFTGNVATDFPATEVPGVVVIPNNPSVIHPQISPLIAPYVHVSGFDINGIRVQYDPQTDTLYVGLEQPASGNPGQPGPVIAGDAEDNGNSATTNPAVQGVFPQFTDFPDMQGSETMGAFLDLKGTGYADVVAGFAPVPTSGAKSYQVALAVVNTSQPPATPGFGTPLPLYTGTVFMQNDPNHPNLEFSITHFSQLYQQVTGNALTSNSQIGVGAFGNSQQAIGISGAFFPEQPVSISLATPPQPPPHVCTYSPPVLINPHEHRHINTAHPDLIRVTVFGTSGFDVTKIIPSSVTLGGAHPLYYYDRHVNKDEWLDATFIFRGTDVNLPPGIQEATVSGQLTDGNNFSSSTQIFNKSYTSYSPLAQAAQQAKFAARAAAGLPAQPTTYTTPPSVFIPVNSPSGLSVAVSTAGATSAPLPTSTVAVQVPVNATYVAAAPPSSAANSRTARIEQRQQAAQTRQVSRAALRAQASAARLANQVSISPVTSGGAA